MAFIRRALSLEKNIYLSTANSGNRLTHGVLIAHDHRHREPCTIPNMVTENTKQIYARYSRYVIADVIDIENIPKGSGAVVKVDVIAEGETSYGIPRQAGEFNPYPAVSLHMKGMIIWNAA